MRMTFGCRVAVTLSAALAGGCALPADNGPYQTPGQAMRPPQGYAPPPPAMAPSFPKPVPMPLDAGLDARAVAAVRAAVADRSDEVRRANGLEAVKDGRLADADRYVLAALDDPSPLVRKVAAIVAGQLQVKAALPKLLAMADPAAIPGTAGAATYSAAGTAEAQERLAVIYALHRLGETRYSHEFEPALTDPRPGVRRDACFMLGRIGNRSAIPILAKVLHKDTEANVRLEAAEALWRLGDVSGRDALIVGLEDSFASDQMLALLALAAPGDRHVLDYVKSKLTDDYLEVSLVSARAAGELGSMDGYGVALKQGLPSADPRQRALAAFAFADIGRPDCQPYLAKLMDDPVPEVRLAAAAAVLVLNAPPAGENR